MHFDISFLCRVCKRESVCRIEFVFVRISSLECVRVFLFLLVNIVMG
jgi:hypothetical protein